MTMNIKISSLALLISAVSMASCSDFLEEKRNFAAVNGDAYDYYDGALLRLADIYKLSLPDVNGGPNWQFPSSGNSDALSKSTEEYSGFSGWTGEDVFTDPTTPPEAGTGNPAVLDFFQGTAGKATQNAWGRIRNINDVILGISGSTLSDAEKNELLGQAYFLRAWCYYMLVKWYGGVPIVTDIIEPVEGVPVPARSSTKECIDFICKDLDNSAEMLKSKGGWTGANFGRVTAGTALALKGRVLLLWASPLFNRTDDQQRWKDAYDAITESIPVLNACGYGLAYENNPGNNAANWARMFVEDPLQEGVFVSIYNTIDDGVTDLKHYNSWENGIRPSNTLGGGGKAPSAQMVDLFPMSDGKQPKGNPTYKTLGESDIEYNKEFPFLDRDPRFYRTFAFPGVKWAFEGNAKGDPANPNDNPVEDGKKYELWNYVWYLDNDARDDIEKNGQAYGPQNLLTSVKGIYIRKRSDDYQVNSSPRYKYISTSNAFKQCASPSFEIRYAEVLLNLAEAAAGINQTGEAVELLKRIRSRVYPASAGSDYGLSNISDRAACFAAILYERQIEFAYEGKRFDDMRRWMLFDGGAVDVPGAPASWKLTGFGGNTCNYLGYTPMVGRRNDNLEFRIKASAPGEGLGAEKFNGDEDPDPLKDIEKPEAIDLSLTGEELQSQFDKLKEFYETYLERAEKKGDGYDSSHTPLMRIFPPQYYLLGFTSGVMQNNATLEQTVGWNNVNGSAGTFDPLALPAESE